MKCIYQLWQIFDDTGDEFLMGTYFTRQRAKMEGNKLEKERDNYLKCQYIVRCEIIKE